MTAKEYLNRIKRFDVIIDQKIAEKEELMKRDISSVSYGVERVQSSPSGDAPQVRTVERLIEYEEEINILIDRFYEMKRTAINQIQSLPRLEYVQLLYKRYVEYKSLEQIAVEMNYTYSWTTKAHGAALLSFGEKFAEVIKNANK